jgi:hypothetical protein
VVENGSHTRPLLPIFIEGSENLDDPLAQAASSDPLFEKYRAYAPLCDRKPATGVPSKDQLLDWLRAMARSTPRKPLMFYGEQAKYVNLCVCADWARYSPRIRATVEWAAGNPLEEQKDDSEISKEKTQIRLRRPLALEHPETGSPGSASASAELPSCRDGAATGS